MIAAVRASGPGVSPASIARRSPLGYGDPGTSPQDTSPSGTCPEGTFPAIAARSRRSDRQCGWPACRAPPASRDRRTARRCASQAPGVGVADPAPAGHDGP